MIKIEIKETDVIEEIKITGHAMYDDFGKDIVCASVSSIAITTINAILRIDNSAIKYEEDVGYLDITINKHTDILDKLIINMIDLFEQLKEKYNKHIEIRRCHL